MNAKKAVKTKVIIYVRVSTEQQAEDGQSIEAQVEKANAYAALYDLEIVDTIIDAGESAKSLDRPGLQRALKMLESKKADAILVTKLDRLTRSVADLGKLIEDYFAPGKHSLLSVGEQIDTRSASGRLVLNILASVSQWEREATGERTSAVKKYQKKQGQYTGGPIPYGYDVITRYDTNGNEQKYLVPNALEQEIIQQARELRSGGLSLAKVAAALDKRGFRSRNSKVFAATQISRMVANG